MPRIVILLAFGLAFLLQGGSSFTMRANEWSSLSSVSIMDRMTSRLTLRGGGVLNISTLCDQTTMGECLGIIGNHNALGNWKSPIKMDCMFWPKWTASIDVQEGDWLEYKYCMIGADGNITRWEGENNFNRQHKVRKTMLEPGACAGIRDTRSCFFQPAPATPPSTTTNPEPARPRGVPPHEVIPPHQTVYSTTGKMSPVKRSPSQQTLNPDTLAGTATAA